MTLAAQLLPWLPERPDWPDELASVGFLPLAEVPSALQKLAQSRMDFVRAGRLDKVAGRYRDAAVTSVPGVRLAVLGSSTLDYLAPFLRLGGLRRGFRIEVFTGDYGMYQQELADRSSALYRFKPDYVLFCMDAGHAVGLGQGTVESALQELQKLWQTAREQLRCEVIQQTILPVLPLLMGNEEDRFVHSPAARVTRLNARLRERAEADNVYLLPVDALAQSDGLAQWHSPALWNRSKQEIHPRMANLYGDHVGRLLGALQGRSAKCLVLDLDNTLWGGVIGDDGLAGIVLGQGSTVGEAHLALQRYALQLRDRGVLLAVCSKNDMSNALLPFEQHGDMLLKREHIACFVANWTDKATNLRHIASTLSLGLNSLVFLDDNPAERALVRRELPMVQVPELSDDPSEYVFTLAAAGYFETAQITEDDQARNRQYQENAARETMRVSTTDMTSYLESLRMIVTWSPFDRVGLKRIVQLANKTNQFNLTTRRYTEPEMVERMLADDFVTLQLRLQDSFGDNGIIALVVGRIEDQTLHIETWLMSCRVLGRRAEEATLHILAEVAAAKACTFLTGIWRPTEKNGMVRDLYERLGFSLTYEEADGSTHWRICITDIAVAVLPMQILPMQLTP